MRRNWWTITSYVFAVIAFLVVASYAVLFATGYKYDWENKSFKKTGFILIETYPKYANVTIAGKRIGKKTPVTVKRLLPGNYLTEIHKDGYRGWQAVIEVKSGLVTEQRNLLLTLEKLSAEILREEVVDKLAISPNYEKLALVSSKEIAIWNIASKSEVNVWDPDLVRQRITTSDNADIANGIIQNLSFGPDNKTLLVQVRGRLNSYYLLLNSDTGQMKTLAKGTTATDWQWLNSNELTFMQANAIYLTGFEIKENKKMVGEVISYGVVDSNIYGVAKDKFGKHTLIQIEKNQTTNVKLDDLPVAKYYQIAKVKDNWMLVTQNTLKSPASIWWYETKDNKSSWTKLATNIVSKVLWDNSTIVYQAGNQVVITKIDLNNKLENREIFTTPSQLNFVSFHFDTLLYVETNKLKSLDTTGKNNYVLLPVKNATEVVVLDPQMSQIISIDPITRKLNVSILRDKNSGLLNFNSLINPIG